MKKKATILFIFLASITIQNSFSQTAYRTIASGMWNDNTIWERTTNVYNPTPTWVPATAGQVPTSNNSVFIRNTHTVTLDASKSCLNLTVETGGKLWSAGGAFNVRVGVSSSTISGTIDTARIDGILGDPAGDAIGLNLGAPCASLWVTGTGTINIGRIRAETGNTNNPSSAIAGHANEAKWIIDKNMTLNVANYAYSIPNSTQSPTDTITLTLNAGRTVTVGAAGYFHNNAVTAGIVSSTGGKYTYNINGTLDLSANLTATGGTSLIPYGNSGSLIDLHVNGLLKLGAYFKADTVANSIGSLKMTIGNGGLVDGTLTSKLITGTVNAATETPNIFFVVVGTGALKRTVPNDNTKVKFDIGTSLTSYTPVTINSTIGPAETYTVSVKNGLDWPAPIGTKPVLKQWNITEGTPGGNSDTLRFAWTTPDETPGFPHGPTDIINILRWNGSSWDSTKASITGSGTLADPWVAKAGGFTSFTQFTVVSEAGPVPLSLLSFNGAYTGSKILLNWVTTNELNARNFEIERSMDGRNFTSITRMAANNYSGNNYYSFTDLQPLTGTMYYRLRMVDIDGQFKFSNIISLNTRVKDGISVYPNPGSASITVNHGKLVPNAMIRIFSVDGKLMNTNKVATDAVQTAMDISNLLPGNYEILVGDANTKTALRFVKQ